MLPTVPLHRRALLQTAAAAALLPMGARLARAAKESPFKISLAQWSLHKAFFGRTTPKIDPLDFPVIAKKDYGIEAIEYVNQFYKGKATDAAYVSELKKRCDDAGVRSVLIMCDGEGALGDPDDAKRKQAVENHRKWVEMAKFLGCHSIRVNADARGQGDWNTQRDRAADGLGKLTDLAAKFDINVIVENHGGLSSNGKWLAEVIKQVNHPRCGTLPDFGNWWIKVPHNQPRDYDMYQGVEELMPFAKGVSAKSYDFDASGNETVIDFRKMLKIVAAAGYKGYIGIEYEGNRLSEPEGIRATKKLLERLFAEMAG